MLRRFCLYGFLKNQQYYEPFILLAFLQMGLSYTMVGMLVAFRELSLSIMEIPSGAIADIWGRRRAMIVSFIAYIIHFILIGSAGITYQQSGISFRTLLFLLFTSMLFFAIGDAFRTGTHKAMIFLWLKENNRESDKNMIYGYTRSWSKIGSAVSVIIASIFVYFTNNYLYVFFLSIIPYSLNIINFWGYPPEINIKHKNRIKLSQLILHIKDSFVLSFKNIALRRLILESMVFEGFFKSTKNYLQPILKNAALPIVAYLCSDIIMTSEQKSVILIGPVYFCLFILSAIASRKSHKFSKWSGSENSATKYIWGYLLITMSILLPAIYYGLYSAIITGFIFIYILQNLWRPLLISRISSISAERQSATILSIESQSRSLATIILAPIIGGLVDLTKNNNIGKIEFLPIAIIGFIFSLYFFITSKIN